jgi:catechol 2,3-dioxygenase-like lactoylglutathione lyase family enzyme
MPRFHVHISVQDVGQSLDFYSALFGCPPSVLKADYAKWMLDDPRVNFAISKRGAGVGINHLGLQFDSDEELGVAQRRMAAAGAASTEERATPCCYAESDKYWINDPQGVPWEAFHTLQEIPVYGVDSGPRSPSTSARRVIPIKVASPAGPCCETPQK